MARPKGTGAPTALKIVKGERKDRVNTAEPTPAAGDVVAPTWLSVAALEVWVRYAAEFTSKGTLTTWDVEAFAGWCDAIVRRATAAGELELGMVVEAPVFDRHGVQTGHRMQKSEWWGIWKDANEVIARVGARFGLTPSERAQLKVGGEGVPSPGQEFLTG